MKKNHINQYLTIIEPFPPNLKYPLTVYLLNKFSHQDLKLSIKSTETIFNMKEVTIKESLARRLGIQYGVVKELMEDCNEKYLQILKERFSNQKNLIDELCNKIKKKKLSLFL